jgi:hypothetical protein
MEKRKSIFFASILILTITFPISTSSVSEQIWGDYEDYYKFSYLKDYQIYDESEEVIDTMTHKLQYYFWNLTAEDNWLHYRCSEAMTVLSFLKCTTEDCYNYSLYNRFDYDKTTETVGIGIALDLEEGLIYTTDAFSKPYGNVYDITIPLDIIYIFFNNYFWYGLFALFLPIDSECFSFKTDYSDFSEFPCSSFYWKYDTSFRYGGKEVNGHYFKIRFEEGIMFDYSVVFENHEMEFKYSENGILHSFVDTSEIYSNISGNVKLEKTQLWQILLESEGITTYKTSNFSIFGIFILLSLQVISRNKKRKRIRNF